MKDLISRGIGYYIVFPSQGPAIFWLSLKKIVKVTLCARTRLRKRVWNRREGAGHNFWRNDVAQGHNINRLKSNGSKMTDKSISTKPWFSICKLNDTSRIQRHYQKTKEWVVFQLLEWSSHSLAYETPSSWKLTTPHSMANTLDGPLSWSVLLSKSKQSTSYLWLYFFAIRHQEPQLL